MNGSNGIINPQLPPIGIQNSNGANGNPPIR